MTNEKKIEAAFVARLKNGSHIAANNIPVFPFGDIDEKNKRFAQVRVHPLQRLAPGHPMFSATVALIAGTQIQSDKDRSKLNDIYADCFELAINTNPQTIAAATGLQIDGVVQDNDAQAEDDFTDSYHIQTAKVKVFLTLT